MAAHTPTDSKAAPTPEASAAAVAQAACAAARIVIVDDEPLNSMALEQFLRAAGYRHVVTVIPAAATLEALRDERPDLLLLELDVHGHAAYELLGGIQADRMLCHLPVVAMTSVDEPATRLRALELGAAHCLVKPIDAVDLALRLRNILVTKLHHDRLAYTDGLTGLPNRESALHRLDWALKFACRHQLPGAVLQIGLGRFKQINDTLGPALGDEVLRMVGARLVTSLRDTDLVTRDSAPEFAAQVTRGDGDEFTVLLPTMARSDHASVVATRIVEALAAPFHLAGHEVFVSCHAGIAVFSTDTQDKDTVLRQAKLAMRHARAAGDAAGSGFRFYSHDLNARAVSRLAVERQLHHALERGELLLHYQPKVDLASGRIRGAEALVRWQHPERGLVGPVEFIEVAEDSGLIVPLGEWVLREALRQLAAWRSQLPPRFRVSVNVSTLQLRHSNLHQIVDAALADAGVAGSSLCLELTESVMMETAEETFRVLHALKALGVHLALDDFGTGYSSLSYLRRIPIDELKIDRSFVLECEDADSSAPMITKAIIAMAHGMGVSVVAEGVERVEQLAFLRAHGCDQYQGYLFSKPVPADAFGALLAARTATPGRPPAAEGPVHGRGDPQAVRPAPVAAAAPVVPQPA